VTPPDPAPVANATDRRLRIVHLFPDLLSVYGDTGNVATLVVRARHRGIAVEVDRLRSDAARIATADVYVIGGGQDRDQAAVDMALRRLGDGLLGEIEAGAAILAVCGGYQSLGHSFRTSQGRLLQGPGIFDVTTRGGPTRFVGPVVADLDETWIRGSRRTIVGFENHSGRTTLGPGAEPLATVEIGFGNNGRDGSEGLLAVPGSGGLRGLRIGTYLHGPLLPRNPHLADALLAAGLARTGQPTALAELDDTEEWAAHDRFVERCRHRSWPERLPTPLRRAIGPARNLVGF
jgi:lipid II isoglutaminyl synthase (glutamine-hydrolysing)